MIVQGVTLTGVNVKDAAILAPGLLIALDANNATSYPGSGSVVYDLSGNGYNHNTSGAFGTVGGVKCFNCTATGVMAVNVTGPVLPTTGYTYIAWARMIASSASWRTLYRATPNDHPLLIELGSDRLGFYDNNGGNFQASGYTVAALANTWVQWVVTGTDSVSNYYINGQPVGSQVAYGAGGNRHNVIGSTPDGGQPFGYIANCYLYNYRLSQEEIQREYYAVKSTLGL